MIEPFQKARPLLNQIEQAGFEAYFVGGSVRDYLLNRPIEDVDIATSALPTEIKSIFPKTVDVGIEHGTVLVLYGGESYEITTFRSEGNYEDFRRPKNVTFIRSLMEDLKRRDFTINAIAMTKEGELIDPFFGQEDLKKQLIRTVGNPKERFQEDALRMMRAIRFVSQLSFSLEENTAKAVEEHGHLLEHIAVERKLIEFKKLLNGTNRTEALRHLVHLQLHRYLPGLNNYAKHILKISTYFNSSQLKGDDFWILFGITARLNQLEPLLKQWKLSNKEIKTIRTVYEAYKERKKKREWTKELIFQFGPEICIRAEHIFCTVRGGKSFQEGEKIKELYQSLPIKSRTELAVTGNDLMAWESKKGGSWIKETLERIERAVIYGEVKNEKQAIKEWLYS
ncbi:CCA tRNA nucleotidyltransferase [Fervidibacillus halotolerans]|uniref:CCA-adding enzyme n=1 Tax=Fervidibacillus halotolerans TaxID=2980027 RepID=A0A9E8S1P8_9BACI|nr:CCA tRNA nucleotidyltransferase [Fervidibacillus halotolerans]WAA13742.1 CCA tRNA nucleotidyltransferase [Fervidibacillus halotolerans]